MKGIQPIDAEHAHVLVPQLFSADKDNTTAYWKNLDWDKAFQAGMKAVDLPYSGDVTWKETWMYWRINHEVMPADMALSCVQCHESLKGDQTCNRCQGQPGGGFQGPCPKRNGFSLMKSQDGMWII